MGGLWPLIAPLVGSLGSFLSGSATFSNLMFAHLRMLAAGKVGAPPELVLALQTLGAAAGNMVNVLNVVAVAAVVAMTQMRAPTSFSMTRMAGGGGGRD